MGTAVWVVFATVVIAAASANAVNLYRRLLDGLAAGSSTFCFACLAIIGYWQYRHFAIYHVGDALDLALLAVALAGACLGFLWWNAAPAKIFMGDTGSLAIGSGLAALCLMMNLDLLLPVIGGLFVIVTLSVVIQVISFRVFHRRVFKMAPLHHHFELMGWPETTVIVRFWILAGLFAALGPRHLLRRLPLGGEGLPPVAAPSVPEAYRPRLHRPVVPVDEAKRMQASIPLVGGWRFPGGRRWLKRTTARRTVHHRRRASARTGPWLSTPRGTGRPGSGRPVRWLAGSPTCPPLPPCSHPDGRPVRGRPGHGRIGVAGHLPRALRLTLDDPHPSVVVDGRGRGCAGHLRTGRLPEVAQTRAPLLVVSMGLLVAVLVPGLGAASGGSSRWIGFGLLKLQPSELMKLALAVFAADLLTRRADPSTDPKMIIVPVLAVLGISGILILKQPDMGTALVLSCIALGILFLGGVPMAPIMKVLGAFAAMAVVIGLADPYRRDRILSFLNPGANKSGTGYQVWQSLIGLGSGPPVRAGPGRRAPEVGRSCPTPTPTSSSRWWGRSSGWSAPSSCWGCSSPSPGSGYGPPPGRRTGSGACWRWASPPGSPPRRSSTWVP